MATRATLNLDGFDEYMEELVRAEKDIDLVAEDCLEVGADVIVAGMQRRAPFERIRRRIRKSAMGRDGNKRYIYVGVLRDTPEEEARIANVWEFGGRTSPSPKNLRRKPRPGIRARPFIRPALRQDAKQARTRMEDKFEDWLER
jgi:HK97 gp10 family phage protein